MLERPNHKPKRLETAEFHTRAVQRVISTIRERLDESLSLQDMAAIAYMSRYHFDRTFRQVTGIPPRRFFFALRIEAATRMLLNTESSVTDICLDVGYNSLGTFIRRFSGALGVSPMKLRMLRRSPPKALLTEVGIGDSATMSMSEPRIRGQVHAPPSFSGPIFIGLFRTSIPEGTPVACAIKFNPGPYLLAPIPRGRYYAFALGLPWPETVNDYFRFECALRGGGQLVSVSGDSVECDDIQLRPAMCTDPPILVNFPALLGQNSVREAA
jgi:AraC family transcriptional regulator